MIPLGILATTAGGAAAGAYELISTAYGTGSSGTITFSSIPQDFKHLQIRMTTRSSRVDTSTAYRIRLNSDIGSNYADHYLRGNGSSVSSGSSTSATSIFAAFTAASNSTANAFGSQVIDILDYASASKNKTIRGLYGITEAAAPITTISLISGLWMSTSAVSSITIYEAFSANWTTSSRFSLYGIRG